MSLLASRFGSANSIRRDRPLTIEELFRTVPSVFSEDKHGSRSERYTYIPTITLLDSLQKEGFTRSLPARLECVMSAVESTPSICYDFGDMTKLRAYKCLKLFCSIAMTVRVATRCCRDSLEPYAPTVWCAAMY